MRPLITYRADGKLALRTRANFPPTLNVHVFGLNPLATPLLGAVYPILACPLFEFPVPISFEFIVEQRLNVLEGYVLLCAAARRHMRRVFDAHFEDSLEAGMAHSVRAGQLGGFGYGDGVVAAG